MLDRSNPGETAKLFDRSLQAADGPRIERVEVPGMDHLLGARRDTAVGARLHREFLDRLLAVGVRDGGDAAIRECER